MKLAHQTAITTIILIVIAAIALGAPPKGKKPHDTPPPAQNAAASLVAQGHTLFLANCAACHGADAQGDDAPSLHHKGLPDTVITATITNGFTGEMPAFSKLKAPEKRAITAYVHSLQK